MNPTRPAISVIVPIYGVEVYLPDCLRSIADQTFTDFEAILVDDASPDGSAEIAERFASEDSRFKPVRQEARGPGPGGGRNGGLPYATGQWVIFIDADDVIEPDMLEKMHSAGTGADADLVTCNTDRLIGSATRLSEFHDLSHPIDVSRTTAAESPWLMFDSTPWNKLFRRTFFDEVIGQWPEKVLYEDIAAMTGAHVASSSTAVLAERLYHWRIRIDGGAITASTSKINGDLAQLRELRNGADRIAAGASSPEARAELTRWFQWKAYSFDLHWMLRKLPRCSAVDARTLAEDMARTMEHLGTDVMPLLGQRSQRCYGYLLDRDERRWSTASRVLNGRLTADSRSLDLAKRQTDPDALLLKVQAFGSSLALSVSVPADVALSGWELVWGARSLVGTAQPEVIGSVPGAALRSTRPRRAVVRFQLSLDQLPDDLDRVHLAVRNNNYVGEIRRSFQDRLRGRSNYGRNATVTSASLVPFFDSNRLFLVRTTANHSVTGSAITKEHVTLTLGNDVLGDAGTDGSSAVVLTSTHQHAPMPLKRINDSTWRIDMKSILHAFHQGAELLFVARTVPHFRALPRPITGMTQAEGEIIVSKGHGDYAGDLMVELVVATHGQLAIRMRPTGREWARSNVDRLINSGYIPGL